MLFHLKILKQGVVEAPRSQIQEKLFVLYFFHTKIDIFKGFVFLLGNSKKYQYNGQK